MQSVHNESAEQVNWGFVLRVDLILKYSGDSEVTFSAVLHLMELETVILINGPNKSCNLVLFIAFQKLVNISD